MEVLMKYRSLSFLLACAMTVVGFAAPAPGYHIVKNVVLGGDGGWDYLICDSAARRIYISRSTHVMVVDADSGAVVGDLPNTNRVHGIAVAPEFNKGFTSNAPQANVTMFDLKTLKTLGTVK